jgi:hypothetical protein
VKSIQARHFHKGRLAPVRLLTVHTMEWPETVTAAEDCARMFATMDRPASAHICGDSNSMVRCVADRDTAWAAPGGNADGLHYEFFGRASQSAGQWADDPSQAALRVAAPQFAEWSAKHRIPLRWLTRGQLRAGLKGLTTHADISAVYKRSDHTDPGAHFPKELFLKLIKAELGGSDPGTDKSQVPRFARLLAAGTQGTDVAVWQRRMRLRGWSLAVDGKFDARDADICALFQKEKGLAPTGVVDLAAWRAAWLAPIT